MRVEDRVWGDWELDEPVLLELLASAPVRRLAGVHQSGAAYLIRPELTTTRLEHSLGALRLVRRLGGSLEEQVAALLHDVPHTAFSHVVDLLFPDARPSYHETQHARVVLGSGIPTILERHGIPLACATEPERWPLLEQPLPDLCADRVDYAVRDMHRLGLARGPAIAAFADSLVAVNGRMALADLDAARWFVCLYRDANLRLYMHPTDTWAYVTLADVLRRALRQGLIAEPDLYLTDAELLDRLRIDPELRADLDRLTPQGAEAAAPVGPPEAVPDLIVYPKPRAVDPLVVTPVGPRRASDLDPALRPAIEATRAVAGAGIRVRYRRPTG